jgi:hypothetical protein
MTGVDDIKNLGKVVKWNGLKYLLLRFKQLKNNKNLFFILSKKRTSRLGNTRSKHS